MAWDVKLAPNALRQLARLDRQAAERIARFLKERVARLSDPRSIGEALHGRLHEYWKYRVGPYRIIARIQDRLLVILVIHLGNRREVYR